MAGDLRQKARVEVPLKQIKVTTRLSGTDEEKANDALSSAREWTYLIKVHRLMQTVRPTYLSKN